MPACSHCHREWTYGQSLRSSFRLTKKCPYCGKNNYEAIKNQGGLGIYGYLFLVAFILASSFFNIPLYWSVPVIIIYFLGYTLIHPHFMKLYSKQQALW